MFKRGNVWWTSLRIDGRKVRKSLETSNKRLAAEREARLKIDIADGRFLDKLPGEEITLSVLGETVIAEHCKVLCAKSVSTYDKAFRFFIEAVGDIPINKVGVQHIVTFKRKRYAAGRKPATINREVSCLSKSFNIACNEWEWVKENPFSRMRKEKEDNVRLRWLYEDEEERLLEACPEWLRDVVIFAIQTGMRQGEILGLTWENVDFKRGCVILLKTKSKHPRTIPLSKAAFAVLLNRKKLRSLKVNNVFLNENGWRIEQAKFGKRFREARRRAGLDDFRFHDLRHTFGTRLAQKGADLFHISRLMGHKHISTTMRYLHHSDHSLANVVRLLDEKGDGEQTVSGA